MKLGPSNAPKLGTQGSVGNRSVSRDNKNTFMGNTAKSPRAQNSSNEIATVDSTKDLFSEGNSLINSNRQFGSTAGGYNEGDSLERVGRKGKVMKAPGTSSSSKDSIGQGSGNGGNNHRSVYAQYRQRYQALRSRLLQNKAEERALKHDIKHGTMEKSEALDLKKENLQARKKIKHAIRESAKMIRKYSEESSILHAKEKKLARGSKELAAAEGKVEKKQKDVDGIERKLRNKQAKLNDVKKEERKLAVKQRDTRSTCDEKQAHLEKIQRNMQKDIENSMI